MRTATYNNFIAQFVVRSLLIAALSLSVGVFTMPQHAFAETIGVVTELPSRVDSMYSVLNGHVENSSDTAVSVWFEYGRNGVFESTTYKATKKGSADFAMNVFRLDEGVTYSYRAVARRASGGATIYGQTRTFIITDQKLTTTTTTTNTNTSNTNTTQTTTGSQQTVTNVPEPVAIGGSGDVVTTTESITLSGMVITGGAPATAWFEWGTTRALGNKTNPQTLPLQTTAITVKDTISGLKPGTIYYYRPVVSNAKGVGEGTIMSATTKNNGGILGNLLGGSTAQDDATDSSLSFGSGQGAQTIATGGTTAFGSAASGAAQYKTASALGWGSVLQSQYFSIDEKGNIETNGTTFGFGEKSGSSFFANIFNSGDSISILPHSFFGWVLWVLIVYVVITQTRRIIKQRQKAQEEKKQRELEMEEVKKYQELALKNKQPA